MKYRTETDSLGVNSEALGGFVNAREELDSQHRRGVISRDEYQTQLLASGKSPREVGKTLERLGKRMQGQ